MDVCVCGLPRGNFYFLVELLFRFATNQMWSISGWEKLQFVINIGSNKCAVQVK